MMNNLYDVLEICLQELEKDTDMDKLLARYPEQAEELRPILQASLHARSMAAPQPSPEAIRRGRAVLLQRAAELREEKAMPARKTGKRVIPIFQRLVITFSLTATLLLSGTGLVGASSNALPGENLYPVKRSWEDVRLFFAFDADQRNLLESEFESERLQEVDDLIAEGRHETTRFSGVFMSVNGKSYVSGIQVLLTGNTQLPVGGIQTGAAVLVTGHTNADGFVELETMELLPAGEVVPIGNPVEVDAGESTNDGNSNSSAGPAAGSGDEAQNVQPTQQPNSDIETFKLEGSVESFSAGAITVNGQLVYFDGNTRIVGAISHGAQVEIEGYYDPSGKFIVTKIEVKESKPSSDGSSGGKNDSGGEKAPKPEDKAPEPEQPED